MSDAAAAILASLLLLIVLAAFGIVALAREHDPQPSWACRHPGKFLTPPACEPTSR